MTSASLMAQVQLSLKIIGFIIDHKNLFCMAQWKDGLVDGNCIIIFGDSKIFYGKLNQLIPIGVCTYHLKDKCQIFCNYDPNKSYRNNLATRTSSNQQKGRFQHEDLNKLVALLPTFNMIIYVEGDNEQQLQIIEEEIYKEGDINHLRNILETMLNYQFKAQQELHQYLSIQRFIQKKFASKYPEIDLLYTSPEGMREIFLSFRGVKSLGIKIQNCSDQKQPKNIHNDGNTYIVKSMGFFTKEGLIDDFGLRTIKTLIKGSIKEEVINYSTSLNQNPIILRYEEGKRPKQCTINLYNYFKKSLKFNNTFLPMRYLTNLQQKCLNINFSIKQTETKKYAQLVLENPKQLTLEEREKIEDGRKRNLVKGHIKKNNLETESTEYTNPFRQRADQYEKKNLMLEKVKEDIYRSVSKRKVNTSAYDQQMKAKNLDHSIVYPEMDVKPDELQNIKPINKIYKNTPEMNFYNSISKEHQDSIQQRKYESGYLYDHTRLDGKNDFTNSGKKIDQILELNFKTNQSVKHLESVDRKFVENTLSSNQHDPSRRGKSPNDSYQQRRQFEVSPTSHQRNQNYPNSKRQTGSKNANRYRYTDEYGNPLDSRNDFSISENTLNNSISHEEKRVSRRTGVDYAGEATEKRRNQNSEKKANLYDPNAHYNKPTPTLGGNSQKNYFPSEKWKSPEKERTNKSPSLNGQIGRRPVERRQKAYEQPRSRQRQYSYTGEANQQENQQHKNDTINPSIPEFNLTQENPRKTSPLRKNRDQGNRSKRIFTRNQFF